MSTVYKVWICIEPVDSDTGDPTGEDIDPGFAAEATCETLDEAYKIADRLHEVMA